MKKEELEKGKSESEAEYKKHKEQAHQEYKKVASSTKDTLKSKKAEHDGSDHDKMHDKEEKSEKTEKEKSGNAYGQNKEDLTGKSLDKKERKRQKIKVRL